MGVQREAEDPEEGEGENMKQRTDVKVQDTKGDQRRAEGEVMMEEINE